MFPRTRMINGQGITGSVSLDQPEFITVFVGPAGWICYKPCTCHGALKIKPTRIDFAHGFGTFVCPVTYRFRSVFTHSFEFEYARPASSPIRANLVPISCHSLSIPNASTKRDL